MHIKSGNDFLRSAAGVSTVLWALVLAGCSSGVMQNPPATTLDIPSRWHNAPRAESGCLSSNQRWWTIFGDARLNALIADAIRRNSTLAAAGYRLQQANINAALQHNALLPSLSGGAGAGAAKLLSGSEESARAANATLRVGYEVDLWGRLAKAQTIQEWEAMATQQDLQGTALSISGDVAMLYWQIAYLNEQRRIIDQNIKKAKQTLALIRVKYKAGTVTKLDLISAERVVITQQASAQLILQTIEESRNAMAILFDAPPSSHVADEPQRLPTSGMAPVKAGIPATVLARRPDVKAAELRLKKALGAIEIAQANFYPTLSLTGALGTESKVLSKILSDPVGSVALDMMLPFLNWNENQLNLKGSKVAYEEAKVHFRQTLYEAMREVENGLSANERYAQESKVLKLSWQNAQEQERLYRVRYEAGATSLKDLLDAQEVSRQAELLYLESRYRWYINRVKLSLALGG